MLTLGLTRVVLGQKWYSCLCVWARLAVRAGELPQQPVPQLPPLLLRNADDVRLRAPVWAVEQAVSWPWPLLDLDRWLGTSCLARTSAFYWRPVSAMTLTTRDITTRTYRTQVHFVRVHWVRRHTERLCETRYSEKQRHSRPRMLELRQHLSVAATLTKQLVRPKIQKSIRQSYGALSPSSVGPSPCHKNEK